MAKLQQNESNGSCWLIIPKSIVKSKGWHKGDEFVVADMPNGIKFTCGEIQTSKPSHKPSRPHIPVIT